MPQPDDFEEQHVLIVGDTEENVNKAAFLVERVLYSDADTRNKIKEEQLKASQEMRSEQFYSKIAFNFYHYLNYIDNELKNNSITIEDHLMTPYGPPDKNVIFNLLHLLLRLELFLFLTIA